MESDRACRQELGEATWESIGSCCSAEKNESRLQSVSHVSVGESVSGEAADHEVETSTSAVPIC